MTKIIFLGTFWAIILVSCSTEIGHTGNSIDDPHNLSPSILDASDEDD